MNTDSKAISEIMLTKPHRYFQILASLLALALLSACDGSSTSTGTTSSSPASFNGTETVNLYWTPPTTRADGSYLSAGDLAGYRIYMGTSSSSLEPIVDLINDNTNRYQVQNLVAGSYYFAITAYDNDGMESGLSGVIQVNPS